MRAPALSATGAYLLAISRDDGPFERLKVLAAPKAVDNTSSQAPGQVRWRLEIVGQDFEHQIAGSGDLALASGETCEIELDIDVAALKRR